MKYERYSILIDEIGIYGVCIGIYDSSTQRQTITPICFREKKGKMDLELDFNPEVIQTLFRGTIQKTPKQLIEQMLKNQTLTPEQKVTLESLL